MRYSQVLQAGVEISCSFLCLWCFLQRSLVLGVGLNKLIFLSPIVEQACCSSSRLNPHFFQNREFLHFSPTPPHKTTTTLITASILQHPYPPKISTTTTSAQLKHLTSNINFKSHKNKINLKITLLTLHLQNHN
jgi:hypothetical protein